MTAGKVVFVTQARTASTRLPEKILKTVQGRPLLAWFLKRAQKSARCDALCVATTVSPADEAIADLVRSSFPDVHITRGSEEDVLARYHQAMEETGADRIVRVTSDCPFFDWDLVDRCVEKLDESGADAVRTVRGPFPLGLDVEVFTREALERAHRLGATQEEREHVGPYVFKTHPRDFSVEWVGDSPEPWPECRLTLDYPEDLTLVEALYREVGPEAPSELYRQYLRDHPETARINLGLPH